MRWWPAAVLFVQVSLIPGASAGPVEEVYAEADERLICENYYDDQDGLEQEELPLRTNHGQESATGIFVPYFLMQDGSWPSNLPFLPGTPPDTPIQGDPNPGSPIGHTDGTWVYFYGCTVPEDILCYTREFTIHCFDE